MKKISAVVFTVFMFVAVFGTTVYASERIPNGGGAVQVDGTTNYSFTPDVSSFWVFETSQNGIYDPYLIIRDSNNRVIAEDDDSGGYGNAFIIVYLEAGKTYTVRAEFYAGSRGRYVLTVSRAGAARLNGSVQVNTETYYSFTPETTGLWSFETSNSGRSDPVLWIYDIAGRLININDDGGVGLNALLNVTLTAGTEYLVRASFYSGSGSYTLSARRIPDIAVSGNGGSYMVMNGAYFSFIPAESGFWSISTSDSGMSDPYLWLYDSSGIWVADDDSGGGYDAFIMVPLEAGRQYYIHADFYLGEDGKYLLTVERVPSPSPRVENPANLFEANQHRPDRPAWMEELRYQNRTPSFTGTNGEWEAAVRELFDNKNVFTGSYTFSYLLTNPVNHEFSAFTRERLTRAIRADNYFNRFPYSDEYIADIIMDYLGFYFTSGEFNGGMYFGTPEYSTIILDIRRGDVDWAVAVLGHEFAHALGLGESIADFVEEGLMGWEYSTQGRGAGQGNPLGIEDSNGLMYNSSFDRTLERLAGQEEFWFYTSFSDHAYGELWNRHLGDVVTFREMQVLRQTMRECDYYPTLAYLLEMETGMSLEDFSERILHNWRTIFSEPHPSNNYQTTPPTQAQRQQALSQLWSHIRIVNAFARQFHISPYSAVLPDVQQNHRSRWLNAA